MAAERSAVRQNYHEDCEKAVNDQIQLELEAMYTYLAMANFFDQGDTALSGFSQYFSKQAREEMDHVQTLSKYQNSRGGRLQFRDIKRPAKDGWGSGLEAVRTALEMEKEGYQVLLNLHQLADTHKDYDLANFLEGTFLEETVATIKELGDHVTNLERVGVGHGEYHFDKELK